ncbi:MAG: hypothetical protein KDD40_07015 [Bdellovibrionales bacterium]|nr:hypothetical protein [Bdellovibrionales bacterium]
MKISLAILFVLMGSYVNAEERDTNSDIHVTNIYGYQADRLLEILGERVVTDKGSMTCLEGTNLESPTSCMLFRKTEHNKKSE